MKRRKRIEMSICPRFLRTARPVLLATALLAPLAPLAEAQPVLRLAHNRAWSNPALLIGLSKGDFEAAGIRVVATEFSNPADMITAMVGGNIDAATTPGASFATAVQRGIRIKAVALIQGSNVPPISYVVLTEARINTPADLRGKKVAVNNYGGSHDINLRAWLDKGNVAGKDVDIITIPVPAMPAALINKQVDMIPLAAADQGRVKLQYPGKTRTVFTYSDIYREALGSDDNNSMLLVVNQAAIDNARDTLVKFLRGYLRAVRRMNADPKAALADWAAAVGNKSLLELPEPPKVPNDGKIYVEALQHEADLALKFGYLQKPQDMRAAIDHSLLDDAARPPN
jgi:NitT/TauT family transport system substrate-binding protein